MNSNEMDIERLKSDLAAVIKAMKELSQSNAQQFKNVMPKAYSPGPTRPGAVHKVNPTFLSRSILPVTPAEYRRNHLGKKVKDGQRSVHSN